MRGRSLLVFAPAAVLLVFAFATHCSSSSSSDAPASDDGAVDVVTSDGGDLDTTRGETPAPGACLPFKGAVYQTYCPGGKSFVDLTGGCGIDCVLAKARDAETPTCVKDCLRDATAGKIGDPCLECQSTLVACARKSCLGECAPGPKTPKCLGCMCGGNIDGVNCYDPFNVCSGLATTYCQQIDAGTFDGFDPPTDGGACDAPADTKDSAIDAPLDAPKDAKKDGG